MKIRKILSLALLLLLLIVCFGRSGSKDSSVLSGISDSAIGDLIEDAVGELSRNGEGTADTKNLVGLEIPFMADDKNVIEHMGYTVSYNSSYRIPNWVAYELQDSELYGDFERADKFTPDPLVKGRQAYDSDYLGSGWDRGHMAPAGDMKWSSQAMEECFYLTNVCPQNHNLNSGVWNDLEKQVRREARYYGKIWIVCGPIVDSNKHGTIGENRVQVPDSFFKALLAQKKNGSYISIAFVFPNEAGDKGMAAYAMTVNELEKKIDMDLFYNLDSSVQESVESEYDLWSWRIRE